MKQILVFVLLSGLLCWLMFGPMYRHVVVIRHALLQQEVDYLLEIGSNGEHGYISPAMIERSRQRLENNGFDPSLLVYVARTTTGEDATNEGEPAQRGTGIELLIEYPFGHVFVLDRLIGMSGPDPNDKMAAYGVKMSEYLDR